MDMKKSELKPTPPWSKEDDEIFEKYYRSLSDK